MPVSKILSLAMSKSIVSVQNVLGTLPSTSHDLTMPSSSFASKKEQTSANEC